MTKSGGIFLKEHIILNFILNKFLFLCVLSTLLLSGCVGPEDFQVKNLAKTNINIVSEIHIRQTTDLLKTLTRKLYKKNPEELKKVPGFTIDDRINQIFTCPPHTPYKDLGFKEGTDAILLGFEPDYKGDRVFAIIYGLHTMIHISYKSKCELYLLDYLNAQDLYNSARNIEILVWRLNTRHKEDGSVFLLTNEIDGDTVNLSYERIFGKLISLQDTMAKIVATRNGRIIKEAIQTVGMAFLPIGL